MSRGDTYPQSVVDRAQSIYAATTRETLVASVKRTGLPRKRVMELAYMGAELESDRLGEDDHTFDRRMLAVAVWAGDEFNRTLFSDLVSWERNRG